MTETIFFNVWQADSRESQQSLVAEMRSEVASLAEKPGFLGVTAWAGQDDDYRVLVEGRWASRAHLEAAVTKNPEAISARGRMERFGTPDPGLFAESFRIGPEPRQDGRAIQPADTSRPDRFATMYEEVTKRWAAVGFESTTVTVNGVDLYVATGGKGSPLVLLHGYPQSGEIWRFVAPELAKTHRVIIPDLRGMGLSTIASSGYDLPNLADDIHQLVAKLDHPKVDLAGHDWGAAVGAVYALRYRADVRKFAFIESAIGGAGFETTWTFEHPNQAMTFIPFLLSDQLAESLTVGREEVLLQHLWNTFTYNKERVPFSAWRPYVEAMKRPGMVRSSASFYRSVYSSVERIRALIGAGKLSIPVLSVSGQASFGPAQRTFAENFASNIVRNVVVANSGHFVAEEQPDALMAEFRSFFDD